MGSSSSKGTIPTDGTDAQIPLYTTEVVHQMCQEAYAAGAEDAGNHYMHQADSTRKQDAAVGGLACLVTFWFTYVYGTINAAKERAESGVLLQSQKELMHIANQDLTMAKSQVRDLAFSLESRDALIERQHRELAKAAKLRRAVTGKLWQVKRQSAKTRADMAALQGSVVNMNRALYGGAAAVCLLWAGTVWWVARRRAPAQPVMHVPAVVAPMAASTDAVATRTEE